jgi:hypothetical protein
MKIEGGRVWRSGATVKTYNWENADVILDVSGQKFSLTTTIASKGGGKTDIKLELPIHALRVLVSQSLKGVKDDKVFMRDLCLLALGECLKSSSD